MTKLSELDAMLTFGDDDILAATEDASGNSKSVAGDVLKAYTKTGLALIDLAESADIQAAMDFVDNITASEIELNAAADGIGVTIPKQKVVAIGAWNMDSTGTKTVVHGLTLAKICGVRGVIISDDGTLGATIGQSIVESATVNVDLYIWQITTVNVTLRRSDAGFFDGPDYDHATMNRGYLTLDYID